MSQDLAIVILNWNGQHHLKTYLPSVVKNYGNARIIVADNNSSDDSIKFIQENFPTVEIIRNESNGGFAKGYNDALQKVDSTYYCLLNSDVEVTPGWTVSPYKLLTENNQIAVCQPKIKSYLKKTHFEYAGAAGGFIDNLGYPFCRGRIFNELEEDLNQYNDDVEIFWATGACMFMRSEVFHQLNGFDPNYFAHMEEIDLCWRIKNKGFQVWYTSNSTVYHLGGGTLSNLNPKKTFLNFRNSLLTLYKNEPAETKKIFYRLVLDGIAGVKFLLEGRPKHLFAILKAHASFYHVKKKYPKDLKETITSPSKQYNGSIISEHFIKGIKQFNQLKKGFS